MLIELISILCVSGSDRTGYSCKDLNLLLYRLPYVKRFNSQHLRYGARPGEARGTAVSSVRVRGA